MGPLPPDFAHPATAHIRDGQAPPPRTKWTRRVPHPVLIGHAASLSQVPFALSHNFEDSNRYPTAAGQQCWYRMQVETSSTYGGKIAGYLTGGLNFQIEHHLFPGMPQFRHPQVSPRVKALFAKHGLPYDERSYFPCLRDTWMNLHEVGKSVDKKSSKSE